MSESASSEGFLAIPLTVVMPAYNEEGAIRAAVGEVQRLVLDHVPGADFLVIDDGSRDATGAILDELAASDPRLTVIHQPNGGHGAALRHGMERAGGAFLFLIDSDRQIPIEEFATFWNHVQAGRDGVFGIRAQRHDPALRLFLSRFIAAAIRALFGVSLRDANVPFKLIRRSIWLESRDLIPEGTLAPSLFLAIFARKRGFDIEEREVPHRRRATGEVSIRRWKLFKFCARGFRQLWTFRRRLAS